MMDSFEQNGEFADAQDSQDMDTGNSQSSAAATRANADIVLVPNEDGVVFLPDGASLENLTSSGRDLVIVLDDGTRIVIPEGAIIVPQIVVDGVTVPAANLAALLTGNEPQPAAGDPQSSGGNFEVDPGNIQAAYDIGDLLPYTQLQFPEPEEREIIPYLVDQDPDIVVETPDNPAGVINAIATVDESGLPARTVDGTDESEGTQDETNLETSTGTIVFNSPDGVASVAINGVAITEVGQTFVGDKGILTITSIDIEGGEIGFSFTLTDNLVGETVDGSFSMTVTDTDGDSATATLQINVIDDAPIARDDSNDVPGGSHDTIFGNVTDNDESGADGYAEAGAVTSFANGGGSAAPGDTLVGTYGELTLNADGSYSYDRFVNTPGGVSEEFTYTITDADGSTSTATLTIIIGDAPNVITNVPEGDDATVVEEGQLPPTTDTRDDEPEGSNFDGDDETATGTITFTSPDGVDTITIGGTVIDPDNLPQVVVSDDTGTLTVTGYTYDPETGVGTITYDYELTDNTGDTDGTTVTFPIVITDLDGDQAEDDLNITIVDDVPEAIDDTASQAGENASISIDVLANDTVGADGVDLATGVKAVDGSLSGTGSLAYNDDGSFTYTPGAGETGTVTFQYTITDGDGDVSTATVTLTLSPDSTPEIAVEGDNDVDEAALGARDGEPAGSNSASDGEIATGVISITTDGDTVASLVINGVNVTGGGQVATDSGVLTITESNGAYSYSFELLDNTLSDPDSESFSLTVTDSDGDTASTTLVIAIIDDAPSAENDSNAIAAGEYGPVGGNVLANDTVGADDAVVTSFTGSGGSGAAGETVQGTYGTLTIAADGTYSYTRDAGTPGDVEDSFDYLITDGDGDTATATLIIAIGDSPVTLDLPVAGEAGTEVDEAGLPAGSAAATDGEFTSGTFTYTAPDGPAVITIGGTAVTAVGQTFTGSFGTLTVTSIAEGEIGYTYELATNTDGDDTFDSFEVTVTDQDGDTVSGDLDIDIVDDVPTARPDTDSVTEDGPLAASGNVITDAEANGDNGADTQGADGAEVSAFSFGSDAGTVGAPLAGLYGTLTLNADGSYTYELDNSNPLVQGLDSNQTLTEVFDYTLSDGDGDDRPTTLTITINGADDIVTINGLDLETPEEIVDEDDLPEGSSPDANALVQDGSFTVDSPDGLSVLTVGGTAVWGNGETYPVSITGEFGTARITDVTVTTDANGDVVSATVFYEYELSDNTLEHDAAGEDDVTDSFEVIATDTDGSQDTASLDIQVIDDVPSAENDANAIAAGEYGPVGGNVLANDTVGADDAVVTSFTGSGGSGAAGETVQGAYGTLTIAADGTYSYTRDAGTPGDVEDSFDYVITDGDGDTATATLVISIADSPVTLDLPVAGEAGTEVDEAGLPAGSAAATDGEFTSGTFTYTAPDGPAVITIGGTAVTAVGQTFTGSFGTLTVTSIAEGEIGYTYELTTNTDGDDTFDSFEVTVTDQDGDTVSGDLDIDIVDDVPTARPDTDSVTEDGPLSASGNVITDTEANGDNGEDTQGADGAEVSAFSFGTDAGTVGAPLAGLYGTLTLNADGSYTYELDNANPLVQGLDSDDSLTEVFEYTITDGDGDSSPTTLTITINGADDIVTINGLDLTTPEEVVDEDDLPEGSSPDANALVQDGSFTVDSPDGLSVLTVGGTAVWGNGETYPVSITGEFGTARITDVTVTTDANGDVVSATVFYEYELSDNTLEHDAAGEDDVTDSFEVIATDTDGSQDTASLDIQVIDDVPTAENDTNSVVEGLGNSTSGNVYDGNGAGDNGDELGADTDGTAGIEVTGVRTGGEGDAGALVAVGTQVTISGTYGDLTIEDDGSYTYTLKTASIPSSVTSETFTYQITDGDGDTDLAELVITLNQDPNAPDITGDALMVYEDGLADGVQHGADSETAAGSFNVVTNGEDVTFTLEADNGNTLTDPSVGDTLITSKGVVEITSITDDGNGTFTYGYEYTLSAALTHTGQGEINPLSDTIDMSVTDATGDSDLTPGQIVISIVDDIPVAEDNANTVSEGASTSGNILTDDDGFGVDVAGADGLAGILGVTSDDTGDSDSTGPFTVTSSLGTLTIQANGDYTYDSFANSTNADTTDTFTYQIIDGDGDVAEAQLVISIDNVAGNVSDNDALVFEAGLDGIGSAGGTDSETDANGQITVTGASGTLTYSLTSSATGSYGTLTLDAATGEYSYTLTAPVDGDTLSPDQGGDNGDNTVNASVVSGFETFTYQVVDQDNNVIGTGEIQVSIVDDVPTATDQTLITVAEDAAAISGNVMTDGVADTEGADGATVTSITVGSDTVAVPQDGSNATLTNGNGTYTIDMDGNWTFDPATGLDQTSGAILADFTYTLTDGDGDMDTATQPIRIEDGAAPGDPAGLDLSVDDQNLADGSTPGGDDFDQGTINFVPGSDPFATIVFGDVGDLGGDLDWVRTGDFEIVGSDADGPVVTLTLVVNGNDATVTATLNDNYLGHADAGDELDALGFVNVVATDLDGDVALGRVDVSVSDDVPLAVDDSNTVVEGAGNSASGNVYDGTTGGDNADAINADIPTDGTEVTGVRSGGEGDVGALTVVDTQVTVSGAYGDLTIEDDGSYTYTLTAASVPNGASETFTYQITDADGDTDLAELVISISQDPNAPNLIGDLREVFEDGLADGTQHGPDSETAAGAFSIQTNGEDVTFTLEADNGNTLTDPEIGDTLTTSKGVIEITDIIDNGIGVFSYQYTYTLSAALTHTGQGEVNPILDTITTTITDATGDSDPTPGSIVISIVDDVPTALDPDAAFVTNTGGSSSAPTTLDLSDLDVDDNFGADGAGAVIFTAASITALEGQGLTSGLAPLEYSISADGTVLTATKSTDDSPVFTIALEPTGNDDNYVVTMSQPLDAVTDVDFNDGGYNFVGGNGSWAGFNQPATNDSLDLLLTPVNGGTVNTNANEGGVGSGNSVGGGEAMRVDYVTDLSGAPVSGGDFYAGDDTQSFEGHQTINGGSAFFTKITSSTIVTIAAFDDDDTGTLKDVGDGSPDIVTSIAISYNGVTTVIDSDGTYDVGGNNYTVTFNGDGTVNVANVVTDTRIAAFTNDGYNSIEWGHGGGNTFKIGDFGATVTTDEPVNFTVPISIEDGDGDIVDAGTLDITALPAGSGASSASFATTAEFMTEASLFESAENDNGTLTGGNGFGSGGAKGAELKTLEMTTMTAIASGFMLGDYGSFEPLVLETGADASFTSFVAGSYDPALDLVIGTSEFDGAIAPELEFELGSSTLDSFDANILGNDVALSDAAPIFPFEGSEMGIDYAAFGAPNEGTFASNDAVGGLDIATGDASAAMEALLLIEAPEITNANGALDAKLAIGEAIEDIAAEASVDALVTHFAVESGIEGDGLQSIVPTEGLLDTMVQPGLAQSLANGLTVDQLDDAALAGTAA